jgi:hypothetical protein
MTKKIVELVAEQDYVNLKPVLEALVAKKLVEKISGKKAAYVAKLRAEKAAK